MRGITAMWNHIIGDEQFPHISAHAQYIIDTEHARVHEGRAFSTALIHRTITTGSVVNYCLQVPPVVYPHLRGVQINTTNAPFSLGLYETASVSAFGTALTENNCNRGSANVSGMTVSYAPTVVVSGTLIDETLIPGGKQAGGFGEGPREEWLLKQDTTYLIALKNESGQTADAAVSLFWYEMENR